MIVHHHVRVAVAEPAQAAVQVHLNRPAAAAVRALVPAAVLRHVPAAVQVHLNHPAAAVVRALVPAAVLRHVHLLVHLLVQAVAPVVVRPAVRQAVPAAVRRAARHHAHRRAQTAVIRTVQAIAIPDVTTLVRQPARDCVIRHASELVRDVVWVLASPLAGMTARILVLVHVISRVILLIIDNERQIDKKYHIHRNERLSIGMQILLPGRKEC